MPTNLTSKKRGNHNKIKSPHDRKESIYIVKEVTTKEVRKELPRMQEKSDMAKK